MVRMEAKEVQVRYIYIYVYTALIYEIAGLFLRKVDPEKPIYRVELFGRWGKFRGKVFDRLT